MTEHRLERHDRREWVQSFIYGTIATLIAMAGLETFDADDPVAAGAIVFVSAAATWCAHAYSVVLGHRVATASPVTREQIVTALVHAGPILLAAIPAFVLCGAAVQGVLPIRTAITIANVLGVTALALSGLAAARVARASALATIAWVVVTAAIGATIVIVELAIHH